MSFLSMFIIIGLSVFFLGDMNINNITEVLKELPSYDAEKGEKNAELFVLCWTVAGIIPVNTALVSLSVLSSIIRDKTGGRINAVYTAPVSRIIVTASYIAAACAAAFIISALTFLVSELYICSKGGAAFTVAEHFKVGGMILVNSFVYSALMYFFACIIKTDGAWSGFGTVVGTLSGFLGGIYIPVGALSDSLVKIMNCTPFIYSTYMFRAVLTDRIADTAFKGLPPEVRDEFLGIMGVQYKAFGYEISLPGSLYIIAAFGIVFGVLGAIIINFSKKKDR
jgi:multidrug/hemolysin transport system permease protein